MLRLSHWQLGAMALGFGLYHALLGFISLSEYDNRLLAAWALVLYLIALVAVVADFPGLKLRPISTALGLTVAVLLPLFVFEALGEVRQASYTTWQIAASGTLLAILAIRQYPEVAWIGTAAITVEVLDWGGAEVLFNSGLIGVWVLVGVGHVASRVIQSSEKSAEEFRARALLLDTAAAASSAARAERTSRLRDTLNEVLPLLQKITDTNGNLPASDRTEALLKEAELRDQIRGRNLLSEDVVKATRLARTRGIEVQLLDDGGLDDIDQIERLPYLQEIAQGIGKVKAGKVVVRAVQGEGWRVTMAAIRKDSDRPDLFIRL